MGVGDVLRHWGLTARAYGHGSPVPAARGSVGRGGGGRRSCGEWGIRRELL